MKEIETVANLLALAEPDAPSMASAFTPLARSLAPDRNLLSQYLDRIFTTSHYSNFGPIHEEFSLALCSTLAADRTQLFANATVALTTLMRAAAIDGEVITTPFSFAASAHAVTWAGASPVFVDIDKSKLTLDPRAVEAAITPRTQAILAVHVYGTVCDLGALADIANRHKLFLIYDAAHAWDVRYNGVPVHRFGDATVYSLHASKLMHSAEGGVLICKDNALAKRAQCMENFGIESDGSIGAAGSNGKLSELHAALGLSILPQITTEKMKRHALREAYFERLHKYDWLQPIKPSADTTDSLQYFALQVLSERGQFASHRRDLLHRALGDAQLQTRKYFYPLCSDFPHYRAQQGNRQFDFPVARRAADQALCLPFHGGVDDDAIHRIVAAARALN
jgi:dTDP-4-amino-4,6-dideoxygalactose transaminase